MNVVEANKIKRRRKNPTAETISDNTTSI